MPTTQIFEVARLFDGVPVTGQTVLPVGGGNAAPHFGQTREPVSLTTAGPTDIVAGDSVNFFGTDYTITALHQVDTGSIFGGSGTNTNLSYSSYVFELVNPLDPTDTQTIWLPDDTSFLFLEIETITINSISPISSLPIARVDSNNTYFTVCFARGTLIRTVDGDLPVETLGVGSRVLTMDAGFQGIRWIGSKKLGRAELEANPKLLPIRIGAGALGDGLPERDLLVSPQHRILVRSKIAKRMFGIGDVLIPARRLLPLDGVDIMENASDVEYWHFLFGAHQIVWSNGLPSESLFTGPQAIRSVSPAARAEITTLFPEIFMPDYVAKSVRHIPEKGKQMERLVQRHQKHRQPIFQKSV